MTCSVVSRLLVIVTICLLPSCSHVQKRDVAKQTSAADGVDAAKPATLGDSVKPAAYDVVKADVVKESETADQRRTVPAVAQSSTNQLPLVQLPADDSTRPGASAMPPEPIGFSDESLTLAALEGLAIANNPTLQQATWSVEKANGIRRQVGLYPNPQIGYSGNEIGSDGRAGQQGGYVSQTIVLGDKLKLNQAVLDQDIQALSWVSEAQRRRVLNDLRLAYFDTLGAQRRVKLSAELEKVAESGVTIAKELFEAKQGAKPDILQAEIQLNEVRILRQNARNDYQTSWQRLVAIVGRPSMPRRPLQGELETAIPQYKLDDLYDQLMASSPEFHAAQARVQSALAGIRRQEVQPIPNLLTQVGAAHDYGSGDDIANVQVGVSLPLFNANEGNISAAHAEYQRAVRNVERLQLALRARLNEALRNFVQARNKVERIKNDILPRADENRKLTEEAYRQGEFDFLRVLTARRTFFESNLRYVEALTELRKADALIDGLLLTGGLDAPVSLEINGGLRGQALSGQ